ncbi:MAG: DUF951 domain-containing protein [Clostridia bacterium]
MDIHVGDKILMKKPHPCGSKEFEVLRVGMDFKIRCTKCSRELMIARLKCEKNIKKVIPKEENGADNV